MLLYIELQQFKDWWEYRRDELRLTELFFPLQVG